MNTNEKLKSLDMAISNHSMATLWIKNERLAECMAEKVNALLSDLGIESAVPDVIPLTAEDCKDFAGVICEVTNAVITKYPEFRAIYMEDKYGEL